MFGGTDAPVLASSFLRNSALASALLAKPKRKAKAERFAALSSAPPRRSDRTRTGPTVDYDLADCVSILCTEKQCTGEELHALSQRTMRVSWHVFRDLSVAPVRGSPVFIQVAVATEHCEDDEEADDECLHRHTVCRLDGCSPSTVPSIELSPLALFDLGVALTTVSPPKSTTVSPPKSTTATRLPLYCLPDSMTRKISLTATNYGSFGVAKTVHFRRLSENSAEAQHMDYSSLLSSFVLASTSLGTVRPLYNGLILAIPITKMNVSERYSVECQTDACESSDTQWPVSSATDVLDAIAEQRVHSIGGSGTHELSHWLYFEVFSVQSTVKEDADDIGAVSHSLHSDTDELQPQCAYFRALPGVTVFSQMDSKCEWFAPRVVEYLSNCSADVDPSIHSLHESYLTRLSPLMEEFYTSSLLPLVNYWRSSAKQPLAEFMPDSSVPLTAASILPTCILPMNTLTCLFSAPRRSHLLQQLATISELSGFRYVHKSAVQLLGESMTGTCERVSKFMENEWSKKAPLILVISKLDVFQTEAEVHQFYNVSGPKPQLPVSAVLRRFLRTVNATASSVASAKRFAAASKRAQRSAFSHWTPLLVLVALTENIGKIPDDLRRIFSEERVLEPPTLDFSETVPTMMAPFIAKLKLVDGLSTGQLHEVCSLAAASSRKCSSSLSLCAAAKRLQLATAGLSTDECIRNALQSGVSFVRRKQSVLGVTTVTTSIPNVRWADVGGLEHARSQLRDVIQLPLAHASVFGSVKQCSGVLLYGPPGTGKTLLAKAVATEFDLNFISVKGPELLDMYVGQSEENVRQVFARARRSKPCVLFFDEMDALAPARGNGSDGGNVMDRVVSQLLTELDSGTDNSQLFVVAATNRPDLLDASLLRPGRLDKKVFLGVAQNWFDKLKIAKALTRKMHLKCDLEALCKRMPANLTGADLYALCSDAMMAAVKRVTAAIKAAAKKEKVSIETMSKRTFERLEVTETDFSQAFSQLTPSLSEAEVDSYKHFHK